MFKSCGLRKSTSKRRNQKKVSSISPSVKMTTPPSFKFSFSDQQPNKAPTSGPPLGFNPQQLSGGMGSRMPFSQGLPSVPQNLFTLPKAENHGPVPVFQVNDLQKQKQYTQQGLHFAPQNVVTPQTAENRGLVPVFQVNNLQNQEQYTQQGLHVVPQNLVTPQKVEYHGSVPVYQENDLQKQKQQKKHEIEDTLYSQYEEKIRPCIDLVDSLRALGVEKDLALPAIVVIGDQSSGKSSVLEALSGVALPRGSGIVTRCPLALKLKKTHGGHEWKGKISYQDISQELFSPSEVEKEIRKAQLSVAGEGVGISHELITLEIRSPKVPDLTLIDLPGIARVAVGNQPQDIGYQIKQLIRKFIVKNETINLVVVPSNVDIATTEALKMAQEVDPDGERTLGILTKPDLVDKGTEDSVVATVRNLVIHLKRGYMIVKCRGQQDIQSNLDLVTAIQKEKAFFEGHEHFRDLLREGRATIPVLAEKLTSELVEHINKSLPTLEEQINRQLQKAYEDLLKYGKGIPKTENEWFHFLIDKIKLFNQDITNATQGEEKISGNETRLITNIREEFHNWRKHINKSAGKIQKVIKQKEDDFEFQNRGRELPGFISYKTFETIIRKQIMELEEPAIVILKKVAEMVRQAFTSIAKDHFAEFHNLYRAAKDKIETIKEIQLEEAICSVRTQFAMEQNLYCQDKDYTEVLTSVRLQQAAGSGFAGFSLEMNISVKEMSHHLEAYFNSVGKRLSSQIPLIILFYILTENGNNLQNEMLKLLKAKEEFSTLLQERKEAAEQRQFLSDQIDRLNRARQYLAKFPG